MSPYAAVTLSGDRVLIAEIAEQVNPADPGYPLGPQEWPPSAAFLAFHLRHSPPGIGGIGPPSAIS